MLSHNLSGMHLIKGGGPSTTLIPLLFLHHLLIRNHRLLLHQGNPKYLPNHNPIRIHLKYTPPLNYPYHHFQNHTMEQLNPIAKLRHNMSKQLLLSSMIFTIAQEEYCKKKTILKALKDHITQKKIQKRKSKNHGLYLMKRRHQKQR